MNGEAIEQCLKRLQGSAMFLIVGLVITIPLRPFTASADTDGSMLWNDRTPGPYPRSSHGMVFDTARGMAMTFGGDGGGMLLLADTWECQDDAWTVRPTTDGPLRRFNYAMAYDADRNTTVIFGGTYINPWGYWLLSCETWEWDGTSGTWTNVSNSGPTARELAAMAYDSTRRVGVLFGGNPSNGETWEWDGSTATWLQRFPATSPSARYYHAMAFDEARQKTVLFGGEFGSTRYGDTWEWDGTDWTLVADTGPSPRSTAMTYDSDRERIVLFGGSDGSYRNDTWEWDGATWEQLSATGPGPRYRHAMTYDPNGQRTLLFGGTDEIGGYGIGSRLGDTWAWKDGAWTMVSTSGPRPRWYHAMAYDSDRDRTILYSGFDEGFSGYGTSDPKTWEWNGVLWIPRTSDHEPGYRIQHALAYDSSREVTVLFGGLWRWFYGASAATDQTWEWNGIDWTQRMVSGPSARYEHAMAYDSDAGVTVLFGGTLSTGAFSGETWTWDGAESGTWTLVSTSGPSPRSGHVMAFDSKRRRTVLWGGEANGPWLNDTWEWDGATWQQVASGGPDPLVYGWGAMAYDSDRGVSVLYGPTYWDTWEWDGVIWTKRPIAPAPYRVPTAMVYDSQRHMMVLFGGGGSNGALGDTWAYLADCNENDVADIDDIELGASDDCQPNFVPDECETDCNLNLQPDDCDIAQGVSLDCHGTGVPDECDLATGADTDCDGDIIPDSCQGVCEADANNDCLSDPLDAGYVQARFGCAVGAGDGECDAADVNGDGFVDPLDVGYVLARFGSCP